MRMKVKDLSKMYSCQHKFFEYKFYTHTKKLSNYTHTQKSSYQNTKFNFRIDTQILNFFIELIHIWIDQMIAVWHHMSSISTKFMKRISLQKINHLPVGR
jgi:hypothetical protein